MDPRNDMPSHVLILGAAGLLGTPMTQLAAARTGTRVTALRHADLDITDAASVRARLAELRPDVVINCAAFTKVDDCEREQDLAMAVNGHAPGVIAAAARDAAARFVHVSSDYVFPGDTPEPHRETDTPGPAERLSAYGRSKLLGEQTVHAAGGDTLIVRTSWVFGPAGPNFVRTIRQLARTRPELRVVSDQRGRPTYAPDLAAAILDLVVRRVTGIIHVANAGPCTWFEFAREIVAASGLATPVHPCTTAEFPRPARRPATSILDTQRFDALVGRPMRDWRAALRDYLLVEP